MENAESKRITRDAEDLIITSVNCILIVINYHFSAYADDTWHSITRNLLQRMKKEEE